MRKNMILILPYSKIVLKKVKTFGLNKKFKKQIDLFSQDHRRHSLHTELLLPKEYGIYSFRVDQKYRALFIFRKDKVTVEIINITSHYQ
jgi:plasmid maintenance system killer protein